MNKRILALAAAAVILAAFVTAGPVTLDVKEHVLANGMKILMIPKPGVPRVVCHVYFKVGSINERPGITGSAHVHEHLMFKGTEVMGVTDYAKESAIDAQIDELMAQIYREKYWKTDGDAARIAAWQKEVDELVKAQKAYIIKDDLWTQYMKNGGTGLNASTSQETTGYYVTLPSNKIELQMLMESDRMMNARFREFYSEKDVIMEERRLSENQPGYFFGEQVQAAFYAASPYHWDVIGWMDDLKKMTKEDLVAFHNTYYVPNNAVAIYVGDFDPAADHGHGREVLRPHPQGPGPRAHPHGRAGPVQREAVLRRRPGPDEPADDVPHPARRRPGHGRPVRSWPARWARAAAASAAAWAAAAGRGASTRASSATSSWPSAPRPRAGPSGTSAPSSSARRRASTRASSPRTWRRRSGPRSRRSRRKA